MNKKHLFRAVVFSTIMSISLCSAAYATTVNRSARVRSVSNYNDSLTTSRGTYITTGTSQMAKTSVASTYSYKLYTNIYTAEHNYNTGKYDFTSSIAVVLNHGDTMYRQHIRRKDSAVVDYIHSVVTYYTPAKNSGVLADQYVYTAMQYYR